jgi:hypothetical protein
MNLVSDPIPKEMLEFLNCRRLPGRISKQQTSWLTGFPEHMLPELVKGGFLKRLGGSSADANTSWWFSSVSVLRFAENPDALSKATALLIQAVRKKNDARKGKEPRSETSDPARN